MHYENASHFRYSILDLDYVQVSMLLNETVIFKQAKAKGAQPTVITEKGKVCTCI